MNFEDMGLIHRLLLELQKEVEAGTASKPICIDLYDRLYKCCLPNAYAKEVEKVQWLVGQWPESVSKNFPVPAPKNFPGPTGLSKNIAAALYWNIAYNSLERTSKLWTGEYGDNRKRLLAWLIMVTTQNVNAQDTSPPG